MFGLPFKRWTFFEPESANLQTCVASVDVPNHFILNYQIQLLHIGLFLFHLEVWSLQGKPPGTILFYSCIFDFSYFWNPFFSTTHCFFHESTNRYTHPFVNSFLNWKKAFLGWWQDWWIDIAKKIYVVMECFLEATREIFHLGLKGQFCNIVRENSFSWP